MKNLFNGYNKRVLRNIGLHTTQYLESKKLDNKDERLIKNTKMNTFCSIAYQKFGLEPINKGSIK